MRERTHGSRSQTRRHSRLVHRIYLNFAFHSSRNRHAGLVVQLMNELERIVHLHADADTRNR